MIRLCLAASMVALLLAMPASAQLKKSDSVVKITATAAKPTEDGSQDVTLTLDIEKPWHIYANPVGNEMLMPVQTTVKAVSTVDSAAFTYPEGKLTKDEVVGDYRTYEGKITIKGKIKRAKGETGPLTLSVKIQACDDKRCLTSAVVKVEVK